MPMMAPYVDGNDASGPKSGNVGGVDAFGD